MGYIAHNKTGGRGGLGACSPIIKKTTLGVLAVGSKREVYTARHIFIRVVWEGGAEFLSTLCALSFVNC